MKTRKTVLSDSDNEREDDENYSSDQVLDLMQNWTMAVSKALPVAEDQLPWRKLDNL